MSDETKEDATQAAAWQLQAWALLRESTVLGSWADELDRKADEGEKLVARYDPRTGPTPNAHQWAVSQGRVAALRAVATGLRGDATDRLKAADE